MMVYHAVVFFFSFCFFMLGCFMLLDAMLCLELCRDVLGLCRPLGLIRTDNETACITALMKSVSTDCTQGWLAEQQHYLSSLGGEERWWGGGMVEIQI